MDYTKDEVTFETVRFNYMRDLRRTSKSRPTYTEYRFIVNGEIVSKTTSGNYFNRLSQFIKWIESKHEIGNYEIRPKYAVNLSFTAPRA